MVAKQNMRKHNEIYLERGKTQFSNTQYQIGLNEGLKFLKVSNISNGILSSFFKGGGRTFIFSLPRL